MREKETLDSVSFSLFLFKKGLMFNQTIIPAVKSELHLEAFIASSAVMGILMNFDLMDLGAIIQKLHAHQKKVILHLELTRGLANDEFGAIFAIQILKVDGLISTKQKVIDLAKKRKILGIYRLFLKDSMAFEANLRQLEHIKPDVIEVLPAIPKLIERIKQSTNAIIISGGLLFEPDEIQNALSAGAASVSVSKIDLWPK
jgi:glycerol uptake operon antiterminator